MKYKLILITIIIIVLLTGCTATTQVKHQDIIAINNAIQEDYNMSTSIKTYITRPNLKWDVYVNNTDECDSIFEELVTIIKTDNIYDLLKSEYNDYFFRIQITMYTPDNEFVKKFSSSYYKSGTTIYDDDSKNEIDNFTTWYIEDVSQNQVAPYIYTEE